MSAQREPHYDDGAGFDESLQADAGTLAARGFASNFVGAWLAFWPYVAATFGEQLEEAYRLTFPDKPPRSAVKIVAGAARSSMALMSAAVRADKAKSQRRRFRCTAWALESYREGFELVPDGLPAEESKRRRQNLARYWRGHWQLLHLVQCVTQLSLFPRTSRPWSANRSAHEAAAYTDNLTDLLLDVAGRGGRYRPRVSRVARFEQATAAAVEAFRQRLGQYSPGYAPPPPAGPAEKPEPKPAKVISFAQARAKVAEAVEAVRARAEAGALTPAEADELVLMLAPLAELAARGESSEVDGVTSEDSPEKSAPAPAAESGDFSEKPENRPDAAADKNIRRADVPLDDFLAAFRPTPAEPLHLRVFAPKGAPKEDARFAARLIPSSRRALAEGGGLLAKLREVNRTCGVYFTVNQGGDRDEDISRVTAFFAEADEGTLEEQHARLDACPLPSNVRVETRKSVHAYWLAAPGCSVEEWREVQKRLIHYFGADPKIKNPSRVMRLPHFNHVAYTDGLLSFKPVAVAAFDAARRYTAAELLAAFPAAPEPQRERPAVVHDLRRAPAGDLAAHKRELGARIAAHESARRNSTGKIDCRAVCHNGKGGTGLFYDPADNGVICNSGCDLPTISRAFGLEMPTPGAPRLNDGRERGTL